MVEHSFIIFYDWFSATPAHCLFYALYILKLVPVHVSVWINIYVYTILCIRFQLILESETLNSRRSLLSSIFIESVGPNDNRNDPCYVCISCVCSITHVYTCTLVAVSVSCCKLDNINEIDLFRSRRSDADVHKLIKVSS